MTTLAPTDDIRVKLGSRRATMTMADASLSLTFSNGSAATVPLDNIRHTLSGSSFSGIVFCKPMTIVPGTKRAVTSIQLRAESSDQCLDSTLKPINNIDLRDACSTETACRRKVVFIVPDHGVAIVGSTSCDYVQLPDCVILQRTQGGMSTYDVHLLRHGSDTITTVEMLPHATLEMWQKHGMTVIDAGPDPVELAALKTYYHNNRWIVSAEDFVAFCVSSDDSDACDNNSDSEYIDGESESSESDLDDFMDASATSSDAE